MRILFLSHRIPFPPNKGDKIRSFHVLDHLARNHEVQVASLIDDEADMQFVAELRSRVAVYIFERIGRRLRKLWSLRALLQRQSITVNYFYSAKLQQRIDRLIDAYDIDVFFCFSSPMAEYLFRSRHAHGKIAQARRIMDLIDVDSYKWNQYAQRNPFWKAWIYRYEARALGAYERRIAREFAQLYVVSEQEKSFFPGGSVPNLHALPNGVDLDFFSPAFASARQFTAPAIVFTGVMDYWPNIEGVHWFAQSILPRIQEELPAAHFLIVGTRPSVEVRRLASLKGVTVTGFVHDVRDYIAGASVCVAPLRIARGIQNKVLEAMAMGKAVVTSAQAFEGVRATPGNDIVVAKDETAFAQAVIALLRDPAEARRIGGNARRCVEQHYTWSENLSRLTEAGL